MLTNKYTEKIKEVGTPLDKLHDLLGIDITNKNYPEEDYEVIKPDPLPKETSMKAGLGGEFIPCYWTTTLFTFPSNGTPLDDTKLKSSLSQALGLFPALSGQIFTREGKPFNFRDHKKGLEIRLNNTGVWFTSIRSHKDFKSLHKGMFSFEVHEADYLFTKAQKAVVDMNMPPLLAVKVTHFDCGSALMSFMVNHVINDGRSTYLFMRLWGQLYRGVEIDPLHENRLIFKGQPEITTPRAQKFFEMWSEPFPEPEDDETPFKTVRYAISKEDLNNLKESFNASYDSGFVSSDDVLCAIVWRTMMRARGFSDDTQSQFERVLDIRESFGEDKNSSYGCGILWFTHSPIPIGQLLTMPLSELALTFRTTLQAHDKDYAKDFLTAVDHLPYPSHATRFNDYHNGPHLLSSSYGKFLPSHIIFNTPASLYIRIPYPTGQVHTYRPIKSHFFALVGVDVHQIPRLQADPELAKWKCKVEVAPFDEDIVN